MQLLCAVPICQYYSFLYALLPCAAARQFREDLIDQAFHAQAANAYNHIVAVADRYQNPLCIALPDRPCHRGGNLTKHRIRYHNPNRANDNIGFPRADNDGIFARRAVVRTRFQHCGGCGGVRPDRDDFRLNVTLPDGGNDLPANPAALRVNH